MDLADAEVIAPSVEEFIKPRVRVLTGSPTMADIERKWSLGSGSSASWDERWRVANEQARFEFGVIGRDYYDEYEAFYVSNRRLELLGRRRESWHDYITSITWVPRLPTQQATNIANYGGSVNVNNGNIYNR